MTEKKLISFQVTLEQDKNLKVKADELNMSVSAYLRWCGLKEPISDIVRIEYSDQQKCFHFCDVGEKSALNESWVVIGFLPFSRAIKFTRPLKGEKRESVEFVKKKFSEFVGV
jgi:hypothetical protein